MTFDKMSKTHFNFTAKRSFFLVVSWPHLPLVPRKVISFVSMSHFWYFLGFFFCFCFCQWQKWLLPSRVHTWLMRIWGTRHSYKRKTKPKRNKRNKSTNCSMLLGTVSYFLLHGRKKKQKASRRRRRSKSHWKGTLSSTPYFYPYLLFC